MSKKNVDQATETLGQAPQTKVDLVVGFLGAGKTTLINRMLEEGLASEHPVVVENEFGEVSVDDELISKEGIEIETLASGCICCTLKGSFVSCLREVVGRLHPSRVIIEPTGLANLSDMLDVVRMAENELSVKLNSVTAVVDASCVTEMLDFSGDFYASQIRDAGVIALTHTSELDSAQLSDVLTTLRTLNSCPAIETDPQKGSSALELLCASEAAFAAKNCNDESLNEYEDERDKHEVGHDCRCHEHNHQDGHVHAPDGFMSFAFAPQQLYSSAAIDKLLEALHHVHTGRVLRAKGFLISDTNNQREHVEFALGTSTHEPSSYKGEPRFVVIGKNLDVSELERIVGSQHQDAR